MEVEKNIIEFPIFLTEEVRNRIYGLDTNKYNIKGKAKLILIYCILVSYRIPNKKEIVSMSMDRIGNQINSKRQYVSQCVDALIEEGILASNKEGTIGKSSTYSFPLEPKKGYSRMKFNDYNGKSPQDIKLIESLNNLTPGARALYCIMKHNEDTCVSLTSRGDIEKWLGASHRICLQYLKELEENNMIISEGKKRYFPQEFKYVMKDIEVKTNVNELVSSLQKENENLRKEIFELKNSSKDDNNNNEVKKLKRENSQLKAQLEKETSPGKVVCKGYTKKEAEIYIEELEEQVKILQDKVSKNSGFEDQKEYDDYLLLQQRFNSLNDINTSMAFELKLYNDKYGPIMRSNVEKTEVIETEEEDEEEFLY